MWQFTVKPLLEQADCRVCAAAPGDVLPMCNTCADRGSKAGRTVLVTATHWVHARRAAAQWLQVEPQDLEWKSVNSPDVQPDVAVQFGAFNRMELVVLKSLGLVAGKKVKKQGKRRPASQQQGG